MAIESVVAAQHTLDSSYRFAGLRGGSLPMMFTRDYGKDTVDWQYLSFEDGLCLPVEMLEPDPTERTSALESIVFNKVKRDFWGSDAPLSEFKAAFTREFEERYGLKSPWAARTEA